VTLSLVELRGLPQHIGNPRYLPAVRIVVTGSIASLVLSLLQVPIRAVHVADRHATSRHRRRVRPPVNARRQRRRRAASDR